jgi:hypothetical protein
MKPVENFNKLLSSTYSAGPQITVLKPECTHMYLVPYNTRFHLDLKGDTLFWIMDKRDWGHSDVGYIILSAIDWKNQTIEYVRVRKGSGSGINKRLGMYNVPDMKTHFKTPTDFFKLVTTHISAMWNEFINK